MPVKKDELQATGKPAITVYECNSGVVAFITPLNLATLRAINLKSEIVIPYPDPKPYQQELGELAAIPGTLSDPNENPEYVEKCKQVDSDRKNWVSRAIFDYAVTFPAFPTKDDLVKHFETQLAKLRMIAELPEDDYEATLFHIVLTWNEPAKNKNTGNLEPVATEYGRIISLAIQTVALTPGEVTAGIRFFRPYVQ